MLRKNDRRLGRDHDAAAYRGRSKSVIFSILAILEGHLCSVASRSQAKTKCYCMSKPYSVLGG